jgi:hypothetical protein
VFVFSFFKTRLIVDTDANTSSVVVSVEINRRHYFWNYLCMKRVGIWSKNLSTDTRRPNVIGQ